MLPNNTLARRLKELEIEQLIPQVINDLLYFMWEFGKQQGMPRVCPGEVEASE